jgi:hypothetical protein
MTVNIAMVGVKNRRLALLRQTLINLTEESAPSFADK